VARTKLCAFIRNVMPIRIQHASLCLAVITIVSFAELTFPNLYEAETYFVAIFKMYFAGSITFWSNGTVDIKRRCSKGKHLHFRDEKKFHDRIGPQQDMDIRTK